MLYRLMMFNFGMDNLRFNKYGIATLPKPKRMLPLTRHHILLDELGDYHHGSINTLGSRGAGKTFSSQAIIDQLRWAKLNNKF